QMSNRAEEISALIEQGGGTVISPLGAFPIRFTADADSKLPNQLQKLLGNLAVHFEGEDERLSATAGTRIEKVRIDGVLREKTSIHPGFIKTRVYSVVC